MKKLTFLFIFLAFITQGQTVSDSARQAWKKDLGKALKQVKPENLDVSLIKLIATPEKYQGQVIQVRGYLNLDFEGRAIYLHKEDYDNMLVSNAFSIEFSKELESKKKIDDYANKYVIIIGTFYSGSSGHMGTFPGVIKDIIRLDSWKIK